MLRTGLPWPDSPDYFGLWSSVYKKFNVPLRQNSVLFADLPTLQYRHIFHTIQGGLRFVALDDCASSATFGGLLEPRFEEQGAVLSLILGEGRTDVATFYVLYWHANSPPIEGAGRDQLHVQRQIGHKVRRQQSGSEGYW